MFCPSCGQALAQQMKYCNRCGAPLATPKDSDLIALFEKRMDSEMEGLFWITVLGVGLILGGIALMKNALHLSDWLTIAFMMLSSAAFMTYFGLAVWQVRRLSRSLKEAEGAEGVAQLEKPDTNELGPVKRIATLDPVPSVTENTTRTLEPVLRENKTNEESAF